MQFIDIIKETSEAIVQHIVWHQLSFTILSTKNEKTKVISIFITWKLKCNIWIKAESPRQNIFYFYVLVQFPAIYIRFLGWKSRILGNGGRFDLRSFDKLLSCFGSSCTVDSSIVMSRNWKQLKCSTIIYALNSKLRLQMLVICCSRLLNNRIHFWVGKTNKQTKNCNNSDLFVNTRLYWVCSCK